VKLQQSGEEKIPANVETVWAFVTDPDKVGHSLPDVVDITVHDATHFDAVVRVGVGPVRGNFKLKMELLPDEARRHVGMKSSGGGFGSAVDLVAGADVVDHGDGTTLLKWTGEAEARGPMAALGGRVLEAQAQKLIGRTFASIREQLSGA
jgi:carbon monoxide dehydrogenase subunit G